MCFPHLHLKKHLRFTVLCIILGDNRLPLFSLYLVVMEERLRQPISVFLGKLLVSVLFNMVLQTALSNL